MTKKKDDLKKKVDYKKVAEELAAENAQLNEALLRERADAENVRKRAEQERVQLASFFKGAVVKELLPFIDNFDRAFSGQQTSTGAKQLEDWVGGIKSVHKQLEQILDKIGVEKIKTVGEPFDPNTMEAVTMEEGDSGEEIVSEELQSGYKLGDELLRPAMVRVRS